MSNLSFTFPWKIMACPFRWPLQKQDLLLATEVASRQAIKQSEFKPIASVLSVEFGKLTPGKPYERFSDLVITEKKQLRLVLVLDHALNENRTPRDNLEVHTPNIWN